MHFSEFSNANPYPHLADELFTFHAFSDYHFSLCTCVPSVTSTYFYQSTCSHLLPLLCTELTSSINCMLLKGRILFISQSFTFPSCQLWCLHSEGSTSKTILKCGNFSAVFISTLTEIEISLSRYVALLNYNIFSRQEYLGRFVFYKITGRRTSELEGMKAGLSSVRVITFWTLELFKIAMCYLVK